MTLFTLGTMTIIKNYNWFEILNGLSIVLSSMWENECEKERKEKKITLHVFG